VSLRYKYSVLAFPEREHQDGRMELQGIDNPQWPAIVRLIC